MRYLISIFSPSYSEVLVYMLQRVEYRASIYLQWYRQVNDFGSVMKRAELDKTRAARSLLLYTRLGMALQIAVGAYLVVGGYLGGVLWMLVLGLLAVVSYPMIWAHLLVLPVELGRLFITNPRNKQLIEESRAIFKDHPGVKIAVAGSYGKTSMKELLKTVLSESKVVAATPANKNVSVSHANFARKLTGKEDVLIIEYGEGAPGDVSRFAEITQPDIGIITGLAPAHLDQYPSLLAAGQDIFSLATKVGASRTYVNADSPAVHQFIKPGFIEYSTRGVLGWRVSKIKVGFDGIRFAIKKGNITLNLHSGLMGRHQVGPLALVVALAYELGMKVEAIERGIAKTEAFEHRMQARKLGSAWVIDDTYNGNIDGMRAGLELLKELPGKRKIYVTPGLVDQGEEEQEVHITLGRAIASSNPDKVVLMKNSVTGYIQRGLKDGDYTGEIQVEHQPLDFYINLEHFLAAGDVVMLQNDWPDNYS